VIVRIGKTPRVSVILPAFNESLTIGDVISNLIRSLDQIGLPYEIIVVDDGSADLTGEMAKEVGAKVISLSSNHGKGYALRKGLTEASGNIIVTMDADGVHDSSEIKELIEPLMNGADIVAGSRFLKEYARRRSSSLINRIGNFLFNVVVTVLTNRQISDVVTSFRAYKADIVRDLELQSDGWEIEAEITIKALRTRGLNYLEVPVRIQPRRYYVSKTQVLADSFRILRTIFGSAYAQR
jgi:glycosyltransferase involved in cell wall biosynthesis